MRFSVGSTRFYDSSSSSPIPLKHPILLALFSSIIITPVLANFWNCIFVISTLGIGCAINNECARVVCEAGASRLQLTGSLTRCASNTTQWPDVGGTATFRANNVCNNDGRCGNVDTRSYSFIGQDGQLNNGRPWRSTWREIGNGLNVIYVDMKRLDNNRETFDECSVSLTWGPGFVCRPCTMCDDGISWMADCSRIIVNGIRAPNFTDTCYNLMLQPV